MHLSSISAGYIDRARVLLDTFAVIMVKFISRNVSEHFNDYAFRNSVKSCGIARSDRTAW